MRLGIVSAVALLCCGSARAAGPPAAPARKPAVLFGSSGGVIGLEVGLPYLRDLHAQGFEVDYTESLKQITWERVKQYNVLVLYMTPDAEGVCIRQEASSPARAASFVALIEKYLAAGGGVFLIPCEINGKKQFLQDLTDRWGAQLPLETIVEKDPTKIGKLTHVATGNVALAYTDQVTASPVSAGVKGIWYPFGPAYNAAQGGPIVVGKHWQVVVNASPTAVTKPYDPKKLTSSYPSGILIRPSVPKPALFAIRSLMAGRVALVNQWPQFSIGSGTRWLYDRQVLDKGFHGRPSDFGRLLQNTFRWLAEPSLKKPGVGGYVTGKETLVAPNRRASARKQFEYTFWYWEDQVMQWHRPPKFAPVYRGLIGAKTATSSGTGTVAQFAAAAKKAGLQFVVFLEDFDKLTPAKYTSLQADCRKFSDDQLLLLPGYTMDANTGDHLFFCGPKLGWPPAEVLTGPHNSVLNLQPQDANGRYTGYLGNSFDWLLYTVLGGGGGPDSDAGYYNFNSSPSHMRIPDLRLYGLAALRYYKDGKLVEDVTDDYLLCAEGTIPPAPVAFNEVRSPAALTREVASGHALTYVQARSVSTIFGDGLRCPNPYVSFNTFPSDGPLIHQWPATVRIMTLGAEEFVTHPNIMVSRLEVSSERGLREIAIHNGRELFRRFLLKGEKKFHETLLLDATIHRNLVLIATDVKGGKAVSFARRCWKTGARAIVFCGDRVNDCKSTGGLLNHGPAPGVVHWVEPLPGDIAGATWDGGPPASMPLVRMYETRPVLTSDKGQENGARFNQTPRLDFDDEGALAVATWQGQLFDDRVQNVLNPWHTFGPLGGPSKLFECTLRYWEYYPPTVGVPEVGWAAVAVRSGISASLFRSDIRFKQDQTVQRLQLLHNSFAPKVAPVSLLVGRAPDRVEQVLAYAPGKSATVKLAPGDWFALFSPAVASGHLFVVREQPVHVHFASPTIMITAGIAGRTVKKGDRYAFELFSMGIPLNVKLKDKGAITRLVQYVAAPTGMELLRGKRVASPGFVECTPDNGAVEVRIPCPAEKRKLTLPLRINGLNRRWSAGLFQKAGYVKGDYGSGANRYRPLGVDRWGCAYVPLYVDMVPKTQVLAGHPVVADQRARELFIQVTHLFEKPQQWHVSVNNPTDRPIETELHKTMELPGFVFKKRSVTLQPGEYRVLK